MANDWLLGLLGVLLGSALTGLSAWWLHRVEQLSARKAEFRAAIATLVDLRERFQTQILPIADIQVREVLGQIVNTKRVVYLEAAQALASRITKHVTSSEFNVLASELMADSNFGAAERYYVLAVKAAKWNLARVIAHRALAAFYFVQSPHTDFAKGRKQYEQAAAVLGNPQDAYSLYTLGFTYEFWGLSELGNGFDLQGRDRIEMARKYYADLPLNYPMREQRSRLSSLNWVRVMARLWPHLVLKSRFSRRTRGHPFEGEEKSESRGG